MSIDELTLHVTPVAVPGLTNAAVRLALEQLRHQLTHAMDRSYDEYLRVVGDTCGQRAALAERDAFGSVLVMIDDLLAVHS